MKVLELFSGTECISSAFRPHGHKTFTIDWNEEFDSDMHADIGKLPAVEIQKRFGIPDVIWAAPDCTTYSLAGIHFHRRKNEKTGELDPISPYAKQCDKTNKHLLSIIKYFEMLNPDLVWFIENPRAGLQKMKFMAKLEKFKHTITYCKFQTDIPVRHRRMKPTNIWTNHPNPKFPPPCKYKAKCHQSTPRGSHKGTEGISSKIEKSKYPHLLCEHIVRICEEYNKKI